MRPRRASYAAKLIPTYGATPIAVATRPRYNARKPPSSRITFRVIPHMVSSEGNGRADVWSAEASLNCEDVDAPVDEGGGMDDDDVAELLAAIMDAVAIDNRERTRSSGYVVPTTKKKLLKKTNTRPCNKSDRTNKQK
jgi:hypothetical protein